METLVELIAAKRDGARLSDAQIERMIHALGTGELADYHVPTVEDVVSVGDEVMVVVTEIDRQGRVNLSRKAAMQRHLAKETVGSTTE